MKCTMPKREKPDTRRCPAAFKTPIERAAYHWWRMHRPLAFEERDHLANPAINQPGNDDQILAKAVAAKLSAYRTEQGDG